MGKTLNPLNIWKVGNVMSEEKIESFKVDHTKLKRGVYLSRVDDVGCKDTWMLFHVNTFDIRVTTPNKEPVLDTSIMHTIEHIGATYLRTHKLVDACEREMDCIYFGPMGCRTGFYLIVNNGDTTSEDMLPIIISMFEYIRDAESIPGASEVECGNYLDLNLNMARYIANKFLEEVLYVITDEQLKYPD